MAPDFGRGRIKTIKKVDAIASAWIASGNELLGLQMLPTGDVICVQRDQILLFPDVCQSATTSVSVKITAENFIYEGYS